MSFKVFIETIGKSFNYSFPDDKSHQLYDFYMLAYLTNRSSFDNSVKQAYQQGISITPPKSDFLSMNFEDKLDYALKEVANELLPKLKKELLEATFWSITCEARHINNFIHYIDYNENKYNKIIKELNPYEKSLFKKYLRNLILSNPNSFKKDRIYKKNIEANYDRKKAYQAAISITEYPIEFVKLFKKIFALDFAWSPSYGGQAWKNICEGWLSLYNAKTTSELFINIDHIYDLQHNTDTVFNKLQSYLKDNSYQWLREALNFKANIKDPHQIIDNISPSFKKLAIKVIFKKFGKSYEEFKNQPEDINWAVVSLRYIEENPENANWTIISKRPNLTEPFIEKFQDKIDWRYISLNQTLSEPFINKFQNKLDWNLISEYQNLSESFIEKHKDKVHWNSISMYQKLSEQFIEKHQDKVNWYWISMYQTLSEPFIEKFKHKVDWPNISRHQKLSEPFIEKHQDKVNWSQIFQIQKLSQPFIEKFKSKLGVN